MERSVKEAGLAWFGETYRSRAPGTELCRYQLPDVQLAAQLV